MTNAAALTASGGGCAMPMPEVSKAGELRERAWYNMYVAGERSTGRQRYFRSLTPAQWQQIYGHRYMYASDFIHANPKAFKPVVGHAARLANRTEELAEVLYRYTSVWGRIASSTRFMALRELAGIPRVSRKLRKQLKQAGFPVPDSTTHNILARDIAEGLRVAGVINLRGAVVRDVKDEELLAILEKHGVELQPDDKARWLGFLKDAITRCDRRRRTSHMSFAAKLGMGMGCAMSAASAVLIFSAIAAAVNGGLGVWYCKMGMFAASLYATAFLIRCATTMIARSTDAFVGMPDRYRNGQRGVYRSLFDLGGYWLRRGRNTVYRPLYRMIDPDHPNRWMTASNAFNVDDRLREIARAEQEASVLRHDKSVPWVARKLMSASTWMSRATDFIYCMDRIVCQTLVSRPLKTGFFRYASNVSHYAGKGPAPACTADIQFKKASDTRWGRFRRATAAFVGHGGADCLGMAVGCGACSATWTTLTKVSGGGFFAVPLAADLVGTVGFGFASVCSPGWLASAAVDGAGKAVNAAFGPSQGSSQDKGDYQRLQEAGA